MSRSYSRTDRIAVVDVETTGLSPWRNDRIVEVAIVVITTDGSVHAEYESLVNPDRDLGPTRIHGISSAEVLEAPKFEQIAGDVIDVLRSARALAGHNISFDRNFLVNEYERLGFVLPEMLCLCTYRLLGRNNLEGVLQEFGIPFPGTAHQAIHDARATAKLIEVLFQQGTAEVDASLETNREWPSILPLKTAPVTRQAAQQKLSKTPDFLRRIVAKTHHDTESVTPDLLAYLALIDRILEDRVIDSNETEILIDAAGRWNLGPAELRQAHNTYIHSLAIRALADGIVTDAERNDLHEVARLLGFDTTELDKMLDTASRQLRTALPSANASTSSQDLHGKRICFTGELASCIDGEPITRDMAEALAEKAGLIVLSGVTKSLDILVVADPNTQSGKAKKARQYGIRILAEPVFWHTVNIKVDDYARGAAE